MKHRFARTWAALSGLDDAEATWEHLTRLDAGWGRRAPVATDMPAPDRAAKADFDVLIAGGGVSLLYAAALARRGWRVGVFDRRRIGHGHREWNISARELAPLAQSGLFTPDEVEALVALRYRHGLVRWHGGDTHVVRGVLDCAIDAEGLLAGLRLRAEQAGVTLLDHHGLSGYGRGPGGVAVHLAGVDGPRVLSARLLIDAMGAESPHACFDLVCPTVGGVLEGLDVGDGPRQIDPAVGEILASTEGVEEGRQHIWEGFPQAGGRYTTYLFHYAEAGRLGPHPLLGLYERFFATLPRYKSGEATLTKATYGFIPACTRLRPAPVAPHDRIVLVGDAAAKHSPLTFCGFGAAIRSFGPVSERLHMALAADRLDQRTLAACWHEAPALGVMGALALMMVGGRLPTGADPGAINGLLEDAFAALAHGGEGVFGAFLRDEIGAADFLGFLEAMRRRRPGIFGEVFARLSAGELAVWSAQAARFGARAWRTAL
jgi:lycopene cyclase CruA